MLRSNVSRPVGGSAVSAPVIRAPEVVQQVAVPPERPPKHGRRNLAASAGRWSARHRRVAILGWLVIVFGAYLIGSEVGQRDLTDAEMGSGQSGAATRIIDGAFPFHTQEEVLIQGKGSVHSTSPVVTAAVTDLVRRLGTLKDVGEIRSPLSSANRQLWSHDGRSVLVEFSVVGNSNQAQTNVTGALAATSATARSYPQLRVEEFGTASANKALMKAFDQDFNTAEHTSLPVTLVILLVAFGSLVAAGVPLLLGFTAVIGALGLVGLLSHLLPVSQGQIGPVVLLIGLAVSVDYSMFYLRRKLEERRRGFDTDGALSVAAATSGKAVLISGITVMIAMAGMFFAGSAVFSSLAMGTMAVVAMAVVGSVTVLPAVLSWLGDHVERGRVPVIAKRRERGSSPVWKFVIDHVLRRPALSATLATGTLLLVAFPALSLHTVDPGTVGLPRNLSIMSTYQRIQKAFPGAPISAEVVIQAKDVTSAPVRLAVAEMGKAALRTGQMAGPILETVSPNHTVAVVSIAFPGNGTNAKSIAALDALRSEVIPSTIGHVNGASAYVGGATAGSVDFNSVMNAHLPIVFAFVLLLAFALLLITFRSLVIALVTIALNMLSVAAAYGVLVLIFQDGWLRSAIGAQNIGGIVNWIPLFLFVVLFGLSMDYHVLILSRIRECHELGARTADAVEEGITSTAGIITSAAVVMIAVFAIFATLSEIIFKELGVALAAAVLIDATVVRIVILPSTMKLLGEKVWYMPRFATKRVNASKRSEMRAPLA
ncbi:MAG: MMPL family transporter [Acidimicrobiales bacterium]